MTKSFSRIGLRRLWPLLTVLVALPALGANYPLELASPRAVNTAPVAGNASIGSENRIFRAYPGIEYNIRAVVVGGAYPFRFTLTNAPSGMTVNATTGEIRWPTPSGTSVTPTLTVRDADGTERTSPWTIAVTTSGFKFVDAVNGRAHPTGTGTIDNPWRDLADIVNARATPNDIIYFRSGVYTVAGLTRESAGSPWERVDFGDGGANKWIAYPGATPIVDFGYVVGGNPGVLIRLNSENMYVDGIEGRNMRVIGFQIGSGSYSVFRRLRMHALNVTGINLDGSNSSVIMTQSAYSDSDVGGNPSGWGNYLAIQDNEFYDVPGNCVLKMYSQWKLVIEDNMFRDVAGAAELKADLPQFSYRHNTHINVPTIAIGGNMHSATTHGEFLFNLVNSPSGDFALDINQDSQSKRVDVYRNTFMGNVRIRNVDSADGPFRVYNNVIVNTTSGATRVLMESVSDASRVSVSDNLSGAPGSIVDATGQLTAQYQQHLGTRGHMLGNETRPRPPTSVSVQ